MSRPSTPLHDGPDAGRRVDVTPGRPGSSRIGEARRDGAPVRSTHGGRGAARPAPGGAMKTMTCKDLGGPCDLQLSGKDANEVINGQDEHLEAAVAGGDQTH